MTDLKLNLGCGTDIRAGYTNVDIRTGPGVDLVADIEQPNIVTPGTVSEILALDVLEHFPFSKTQKILNNWSALLIPSGRLIVRVPNLERIALGIMLGEHTFFEFQRLVYGGQDYPYNFHFAGFDEKLLSSLLIEAGCEPITVQTNTFGYNVSAYNITIISYRK